MDLLPLRSKHPGLPRDSTKDRAFFQAHASPGGGSPFVKSFFEWVSPFPHPMETFILGSWKLDLMGLKLVFDEISAELMVI